MPYMYIKGFGMVGPSPPQGCDRAAQIGAALPHAVATAFGTFKGTAAKLFSIVKASAPALGTYSGAAATALGSSEATAATVSAGVSGVAETAGGAIALYADATGVYDLYKQVTDTSKPCPVAGQLGEQ